MTVQQIVNGSVPELRVRQVNSAPVADDSEIVLYWMTSARRTRFNLALQRAADWARHLGKPLLVLEALRCDYRWASDRLHRFIIEGMVDNAAAFAEKGVAYLPYVEPEPGAGRGLLDTLFARAGVVVTDDFPTFFLPRMIAAAGAKAPIRFEAIDSNGLLPMAAADRVFATAYSFRRFVQRNLLEHIQELPLESPLAEELPPTAGVPRDISDRWVPFVTTAQGPHSFGLEQLPIDHGVGPAPVCGGSGAASQLLRSFVDQKLERYSEERNRPEIDATSGLSPYLHFGHISVHEIFLEVVRRERWSPDRTIGPANGRRAGWWGMGDNAEAFLDQVVTWRELGFNVCAGRDDHDQWESLPPWAQKTLTEHVVDSREHTYSLDEFASSGTHDALWNAAQNQLVREGTIHNYLRMLWGKKILEWTSEPREALEVMIELNNRFALDGRDPNSYTGIFWVLGRHDRPWGPERPVFGKVRYMSSANTARKFPTRRYIEKHGSTA